MKKWKFAAAIAVTAITASFLTLAAVMFMTRTLMPSVSVNAKKLSELETVIARYYIDDYDSTALGDAAAEAMIASLDDPWSYYVPASAQESYEQQVSNSYQGIGASVEMREGDCVVSTLTEDGPAARAGLRVGDVIIAVDGASVEGLSLTDVVSLVRGAHNTAVELTVRRDGREQTLTVRREKIRVEVAYGEILTDGIGYVVIDNFDEDCFVQTQQVVWKLLQEGAKGLIFDVRFNPGGMRSELVDVLDMLLPEGELFHSVEYDGTEETDASDAACIELPMAVLVNRDSYSAAEFFAAALQEYEWATIIGEKTVGKGNYQYSFTLSDGSIANVSTGKYFTPSGKSLAGTGVTPDIAVSMSDEEMALLYYGRLGYESDPQLREAIRCISERISK